MSIYFPSLGAVQYTGKAKRRFVEAGGAEVPFVETGDVVILPKYVCALMLRKKGFKAVDLKDIELDLDESLNPTGDEPTGDEPTGVDQGRPDADEDDAKEEFNLPFVDELDNYSKKEIIKFAKYVQISTNKKSAEKLKEELKAFLPIRDDSEST